MNALFDSHCHLEHPRFENDRDAVLERMAENGVERCLLAGSDRETSAAIAKMIARYPSLYGAVGTHPHEAKTFQDGDFTQMNAWLSRPRIVAVGEIGLDYYYDLSPRDIQQEVFEKQLWFAHEQNKPAIFHVRDAHGDMLEILNANKTRLPTGVLHCYSGSVESARQYLDMGFYLSFAGPVTFRNATRLAETVAFCPLDRLLIETDSPYLAPEPQRGKRNEPAFVRLVAMKVAALKGIDTDSIALATMTNACLLFNIEPPKQPVPTYERGIPDDPNF